MPGNKKNKRKSKNQRARRPNTSSNRNFGRSSDFGSSSTIDAFGGPESFNSFIGSILGTYNKARSGPDVVANGGTATEEEIDDAQSKAFSMHMLVDTFDRHFSVSDIAADDPEIRDDLIKGAAVDPSLRYMLPDDLTGHELEVIAKFDPAFAAQKREELGLSPDEPDEPDFSFGGGTASNYEIFEARRKARALHQYFSLFDSDSKSIIAAQASPDIRHELILGAAVDPSLRHYLPDDLTAQELEIIAKFDPAFAAKKRQELGLAPAGLSRHAGPVIDAQVEEMESELESAPESESAAASAQTIALCPKLIMFDLDGTLAHTLPQLTQAVCAVAQDLGFKVPSAEEVSCYVGNGMDLLLARAILGRKDITLAEVPAEQLAKARESFSRHYMAGLKENFEVYPGVLEGLEKFKRMGIKLAVVSNKPNKFVRPLMEYMGFWPYLDLAMGGEVLPKKKPDPMPLNYVLKRYGIEPHEAMMVGDSNNDIRAGKNAGVVTVALTYGYNGGQDLHEENPDYLYDDFVSFAAQVEAAYKKSLIPDYAR